MFEKQIKELIDSPENFKIFLSSTGAGAGLQKILWDVPGISKVLVGANFTYHPNETDEFIGFKPEKYCSHEVATHMAMAAYQKALNVCGPDDTPVGFGLTGVVSTNHVHRGDHRIHVAVISEERCSLVTCILGKENSHRQYDGYMSDLFGLITLFNTTTKRHMSYKNFLRYYDKVHIEENAEEIFYKYFLDYPIHLSNNKKYKEFNDSNMAYFPGSFNPPHFGHFGIANKHKEDEKEDVIFSISSDHPVKDHLTVQDMLYRSLCLHNHNRMFVVGEPLYVDKAKKHPNKNIILGSDTFIRLMDPKWGIDPQEIVNTFKETKVKLHLTVRNKQLLVVNHIIKLHNMDDFVIIHEGEWDISSTELRNVH